MDPPLRCFPALAALYKGYHLDIADQLNCDGPVVNGKNLLRWKEIHFDSTVEIQKWLYPAQKELDTCHLKFERCPLLSAKS